MNLKKTAEKNLSNYENGLDTKLHILDACKSLFYNNGYEKTTFKDIGALAEVNQGLIVYHYTNKKVLANHVFQFFITELTQQVEKKYKDEDLLTKYFVQDHLYFRLIYQDESFRNFIYSSCENGILKKNPEIFDPEYRKYYDQLTEFLADDYITDSTLQEGLMVVYEGMKNNYSSYICKNYEKMPVDVASTNYISIYCHLLEIPKNVYGEKMLRAQLLANKINMQVKDFKFEFI